MRRCLRLFIAVESLEMFGEGVAHSNSLGLKGATAVSFGHARYPSYGLNMTNLDENLNEKRQPTRKYLQ